MIHTALLLTKLLRSVLIRFTEVSITQSVVYCLYLSTRVLRRGRSSIGLSTWRIVTTWYPSMETRGLILRRTRSSIGVRQSTRVHLCMKTTTNGGISHLVSSEVGSFDGMRLSRRRIRNSNAIVDGGVVVMVALPTATQGKDGHLKQKVRRHSFHWFQRDQNELDPQRFNEQDIENDVMSTSMMFYPCRNRWSSVSCSLTGHVKWQWRWYSACAMDILSSVLQQEIVVDLE